MNINDVFEYFDWDFVSGTDYKTRNCPVNYDGSTTLTTDDLQGNIYEYQTKKCYIIPDGACVYSNGQAISTDDTESHLGYNTVAECKALCESKQTDCLAYEYNAAKKCTLHNTGVGNRFKADGKVYTGDKCYYDANKHYGACKKKSDGLVPTMRNGPAGVNAKTLSTC